MNTVFESVINMSLTGSVVIMVVILARLLLRGMPKKYSYALWSVVAFRLCCPFGIKSVFSIFNFNPIQSPSDIAKPNGTMNYIHAPITAEGFDQTAALPNTNITGGADAGTNIIVSSSVWLWIWLTGIVLMLGFAVIGYIRTKRQLSNATKYYDNIYQSDKVSSPFILGIIKPKIYIPYDIDDNFEYVIAHEKYHIKRCDHIIKLLAFIILSVHWFNPLCWLAFSLMAKDMEMSCDEKVLSANNDIKKEYSSALLSFASNRKFPSPSPLCFGEGSIKGRIKNILKYKKPKMIISVISVALAVVVIAGCSLNPDVQESISNNLVTNAIVTNDEKIDGNTYQCGKVIAESPLLSSIMIDGNKDFPKVVIDGNRVTIYDAEDNIIADGEGEKSSIDIEQIDQNTVELNNSFFLADSLTEYFNNSDKIEQLSIPDFTVYYKNGEPFALGGQLRIFELMPYMENMQAEVSDAIKRINTNTLLTDGNLKYYTEAHDTLQVARGDVDGNNKDDYVTVFTYPYCAVLKRQNEILCDISSTVVPTAVTFKLDGDKYTYHSYWKPTDDPKEYRNELEEKFPEFSIFAYSTDDIKLYYDYFYKIKREAYKSAIEQTDYNSDIAAAIDMLCKNDGLYGKNLLNYSGEYNGVYYDQYNALICYGEYTMRYIYTEFLKGGQTDIRGDVMAYMMKQIIGDELKNICNNGQEYFDSYLKHIVRIYNENKGEDESYAEMLKENEPFDYLLLEITDNL